MTEAMKPSGSALIGAVPFSWDVKPLKYCVAINKEVLLESTRPDYAFRYIDIGSVNFADGITGYEEVTFDNAPSRARRIVHCGDTIVSTVRTYLKAISRIDDDNDVVASTGFAVLMPIHINSCFLEFFCKSNAFCDEIDKQSAGIAYPAVNTSQVGRVYMPIPPIPEQQAIAAFLDDRCRQIDGIVADLERQVEILRQYKKALITETVTKGLDKAAPMKDSGIDWIGNIPTNWMVKNLRFLGAFQNGISKDGDSFGTGYPFVSYGDAYNNFILPTTVEGLVESTKNERRLYSVQEGDVFFTRTSETIEEIGFASVCRKTIEDATFAGFLIRFRPTSQELLPGFATYYFRADALRSYFVKEMMIVTRASLGQNLLKNLPMLLPPIEDQKVIADFLDHKCTEVDDLIAEKQKAAETMRQYKKSLIYEYVTGKKRVAG